LCPARAQHVGDRDELLPRAAVARAPGLRRFDLLPVAEGHDVRAARLQQPVEPGASFLAAAAAAEIGRDPLGNLIAVRPVGADRAARPPPRPADAIEAVADRTLAVGEAAAIRFVGYALDGRR